MNRRAIKSTALLVLALVPVCSSGPTAQAKRIEALMEALRVEPMGKRRAPNFTLQTLAGDTVSLRDFRGQVLVLHFWATWCKPCRTEMPELQRLADSLAKQVASTVQHADTRLAEKQPATPIAFFGVSIDKREDAGKIAPALQQMGVRFPNAPAFAGTISDAYWTWGIPVTYLIDAAGRLVGRLRGSRRWTRPEFLELLRRL